MLSEINICIIVPCYNEENNFHIEEYEKIISEYSDVLICFVDDGSTDQTKNIINKFLINKSEKIILLSHDGNKGKAEAVRTGITYCNTEYNHQYIAFLDADLSTSIDECLGLREYLQHEVEFCFSSRIHYFNSKIQIKKHRYFIGRILRPIISKVLNVNIYDTQCGCKLFTKELSIKLFKDQFISKWLFDIELFARAIKIYGKYNIVNKMCEVPVKEWIDSNNTNVKPSYFFRLWYDLYKIRKKYIDNKPS